MAYIKTLKDNELVGGQDQTDVYPVSTTQAIFSQMPDGTVPPGIKHQRLEERLEDIEEDAKELHNKVSALYDRIDDIIAEFDNKPTVSCDCPKHVFLTQEEYDALEVKERDVLYFIIKSKSTSWVLGDNLPMILSDGWVLGDNLPMILHGGGN